MPQPIAIHPHRRGLPRQLARPHHPQHDVTRHVQAAAIEAETAPGAVKRNKRVALPLDLRHPRSLMQRQTSFDVPERFRPRPADITSGLLLGNRRTFPQPRHGPAGPGQHPVQLSRVTRLPPAGGLVTGTDLARHRHTLIPQPPTARPLRFQAPAGARRQPQPVGEPAALRSQRHPINLLADTDNARYAQTTNQLHPAPLTRELRFLPRLKAAASTKEIR